MSHYYFQNHNFKIDELNKPLRFELITKITCTNRDVSYFLLKIFNMEVRNWNSHTQFFFLALLHYSSRVPCGVERL